MRRLLSHLTTLVLLTLFLTAHPALAQAAGNASWFYPMLYADGSMMHLLSDDQLEAIAGLPSKEIHAIVEAMFLAAAGVEEAAEIRLWKTYRTQQERNARSAHNAAYRVNTLPWLLKVFAAGNRPAPMADELQNAVRPTAPTPAAAPDPAASASPAEWTIADGMAAFNGNEHGRAYLDMLIPLGGIDGESCIAVMQAVVQRWLSEIEHHELTAINDHYQFWLYAPATPIDYPVVQCGNNSYYLDHMFNRRANKAGTLFADCRNLTDFRDPNTLIYGHHMRDGSMFHSLTDYESQGFFDAHPFMVAICRDAIYVIEVLSGYVTDGSDHCYDIAISDENDMRDFVATAQRKSNFDAHVEIDCRKDRLVTLSTCAYNMDNARYVVIGRLDPAWKRDPLFLAE